MRLHAKKRTAATAVECAFVFPVTFLLLLGLVVGGLGVFRYQEMAHLARQAARYAATHGTQWARETNNTAATPTDIYNAAVVPAAVSLDLTQLTCSVNYNTSNDVYHTNTVNGQVVATYNTVSVTLTYQWIPESFLGGVSLTSTAVINMSY
jgi:Flp pilus assembly protein TadG